MTVAVIYHFYPHYREPVFRALSDVFDGEIEYVGADLDDLDGVKTTKFWLTRRHFKTGFRRYSNFIFLPGITSYAMQSRASVAIVLAHPYAVNLWLAVIILRIRGVKVLLWTHGWLKAEQYPKRAVRKLLYSLGDMLLLYGHRAKQLAVSYGWCPDKVAVIYNSLSGPMTESPRRSLKTLDSESCISFGFIGRLVEKTGLPLLLEAAAQGMQNGLHVRIEVVGAGPMRDELAEMADRLGVEVCFLGAVYDQSALEPFFDRVWAIVSPGKIGLAAMHALMFGCPVITHSDQDDQGPEVEAIVDGVNGALFERGDVGSLREAMTRVVVGQRQGTIAPDLCVQTINERYNADTQAKLIKKCVDAVNV